MLSSAYIDYVDAVARLPMVTRQTYLNDRTVNMRGLAEQIRAQFGYAGAPSIADDDPEVRLASMRLICSIIWWASPGCIWRGSIIAIAKLLGDDNGIAEWDAYATKHPEDYQAIINVLDALSRL